MKYTIQLVGVGGQGVLLASTVLGNAAMLDGHELAMSEVHGMAQRGGSVLSTLRMGDDILSPLSPRGGADVILGFEPVETYRALEYANEDTYIITNTHPTIPVGVSMGTDTYPDVNELIDGMRSFSERVVPVDATSLAIEAGKAIAANSVLIGAVAAVENIPLPSDLLRDVLLERVPERFVDVNRKAFELGYEVVRSSL